MTLTSSLTISRNTGKLVETRDDANSCRTCAAPVDLTMTVLLKNQRVVGCPACEWGCVSTTQATGGSRPQVAA